MVLVSSFCDLVQPLAVLMTAPSFTNFRTLLTGWVFASRRTVTGMIVAAGAVGKKHHSAFHRLFAAARWSRDAVGLGVLELLGPSLGTGTVLLAVDDTLARKRGLKIFGVGMHHDPLLSSRKKAITNWGHSWVVLGVIVTFPLWPNRPFCLPILFRLYLNQKAAAKHRWVYRTRPELAVELLRLVCRWQPSRHFHVIADSAYGGQSVLTQLPTNCDLTSRLVLAARLYDAPPARQPGTEGRPRKRGPRPTAAVAEADARGASPTNAAGNLHGRQDKVRLCDTVAYVYAAPDRPLRVVAVEPLTGGRPRQAFYSTCHEASAKQVLCWNALRWSLEVAFHDSKGSLGFEEPQGWTRRAVERTAPMAMLLYSLIVLWFVRDGHRHHRAPDRPWYRTKRHASFADMLQTLRQESLREQVFAKTLSRHGYEKLLEHLQNAAQQAAKSAKLELRRMRRSPSEMLSLGHEAFDDQT